jgi:tRNA A37 N6-isopentenylltransferase MiaA
VTFAKRQRTWFRREPALAVVDATSDALTPAIDALNRFLGTLGDASGRGRGAGILLPP